MLHRVASLGALWCRLLALWLQTTRSGRHIQRKRTAQGQPGVRFLQAWPTALWLLFFYSLVSPALGASATLQLAGTGGALGTMRQMGLAFAQYVPDVTVNVLPSLGSNGGIKAVLAGAIDIGLSARALKEEEMQAGGKAVAYARVPFVFATPQDNPHHGLSRATIVEIYAGSRTTWPDGSLIRLVLRPKTDTTRDVLQAYIPGLEAAYATALQRRELPVAITDQEAADAIQAARWGLGTCALPVLLSEKRPLKALQLDNVAPIPENVANGSYALAKTFYFVTTASPRPLVQQFLAFVRSDTGVAILQHTGHLRLAFTVEE